MAIYDFNTINTVVPIEDVLTLHGIEPSGKGWYRLRPEDDTPSAHIDKAKIGNAIHDFGGGVVVGDRVRNTLNPISLTMYLNNCDAVKASQILGEAFHIHPRNPSYMASNGLSDMEWIELGVQPDMASKNIDFYPEKFGVERTAAYADKYRIPVEKLRTVDMKMYEKIIRSRAIPHLFNLRNEYYREMYNQFSLAKAVNSSYDVNKVLKANLDEFSSLAKDLNRAENILSKAIKDTSIKFKFKVHNVEVDFSKIVSGDLAFEIGECCYTDIKDEYSYTGSPKNIGDISNMVFDIKMKLRKENPEGSYPTNEDALKHMLEKGIITEQLAEDFYISTRDTGCAILPYIYNRSLDKPPLEIYAMAEEFNGEYSWDIQGIYALDLDKMTLDMTYYGYSKVFDINSIPSDIDREMLILEECINVLSEALDYGNSKINTDDLQQHVVTMVEKLIENIKGNVNIKNVSDEDIVYMREFAENYIKETLELRFNKEEKSLDSVITEAEERSVENKTEESVNRSEIEME